MEARFEMGEVLLTASIFEVLGQFLIRVVARNLSLSNQVGEPVTGNSGQLGRLAERQDALRIKCKRKFDAQARLHLRHGQPQTAGYGLRDVKMQRHVFTRSII